MDLKAIKELEKALRWLKLSMTFLVVLLFVGAFGGFKFLIPSKKSIVKVEIKPAVSDSDDLFGNEVENGIHTPTGFIAQGDYGLVIQNCLSCHSSKLVIQNRMKPETWRKTIKWMQETQNLWDLGENEDKIVAYLGQYYAPENVGRRKPLEVEEWYTID